MNDPVKQAVPSFLEAPQYPTLQEFLDAAREASDNSVSRMERILYDTSVVLLDVEYNGGGDSGQIEGVRAFDQKNREVELSDADAKILEEFAYDKLGSAPFDWVNNEGGYGHFKIDLLTGTLTCDHHERVETSTYTEFDGESWEPLSEPVSEDEKELEVLRAFVLRFDEWREKGDGIADAEGGFAEVEAAREEITKQRMTGH